MVEEHGDDAPDGSVRASPPSCGASETRAKMRGQARRMRRRKFSESAHASNRVLSWDLETATRGSFLSLTTEETVYGQRPARLVRAEAHISRRGRLISCLDAPMSERPQVKLGRKPVLIVAMYVCDGRGDDGCGLSRKRSPNLCRPWQL